MKQNMPKREMPDFEEVENEKIELDVDNVLVRPIDGVIIGGDDEEIKLLFYYTKPETFYDDYGTTQCKCVAEFRMSCTKFMDIANEINELVKEIQKKRGEMEMFA